MDRRTIFMVSLCLVLSAVAGGAIVMLTPVRLPGGDLVFPYLLGIGVRFSPEVVEQALISVGFVALLVMPLIWNARTLLLNRRRHYARRQRMVLAYQTA